MKLTFASPLSAIRGVGAAGERVLNSAGLATVRDVLWNLPHRYEDRSEPQRIASLTQPDTMATVGGRLVQVIERRARNRRLREMHAAEGLAERHEAQIVGQHPCQRVYYLAQALERSGNQGPHPAPAPAPEATVHRHDATEVDGLALLVFDLPLGGDQLQAPPAAGRLQCPIEPDAHALV